MCVSNTAFKSHSLSSPPSLFLPPSLRCSPTSPSLFLSLFVFAPSNIMYSHDAILPPMIFSLIEARWPPVL